MAKVEYNLAINSYSARRALNVSSSHNYNFFRSQGSLASNEYNDLGDDGFLPDDRPGEVMGMHFRLRTSMSAMTPTRAEALAHEFEMIRGWIARLFINNTEVVRRQLWELPHSPAWVSGQIASTATESVYVHQNGGYQGPWINQEVPSRQTIRVNVEDRGISLSALTETIYLECTLCCADKRQTS